MKFFIGVNSNKEFKNKIHYQELTSLLNNNTSSLSKAHDKWYRSFETGTIEIKNQLYTLQATENKRQLVYKNNILTETKPFIINSNKEIID